jgi:hypothetical protein
MNDKKHVGPCLGLAVAASLVALFTPGRASADEASAVSARIETRTSDGDWATVCSLPCSATLSPDLVYRVGGDGLVPSREFQLGGSAADLQVHPVTRARRGLGYGLIAAAPVALIVGLGLAGWGVHEGFSVDEGGGGNPGAGTLGMAAGLAVAAGGVVSLLVGVSLASQVTKVDGPQDPPAAASTGPLPLRAPISREESAPLPWPKTTGASLYSVRF